MKRKWCFLVLALTIGMLSTDMGYVMAASGLSEAEELILDRLREGVEMKGIVVQLPVSYLNQAENELIKNDVDITAEQAMIINSKIDEVAEIVKTMSMTEVINLKNSDTFEKLIGLLEEAASVVNYTVSIDLANSTVNVLDSNGKFIVVEKNVINQTGFDLTATVVVGSVLATLLAACMVIASKMKLFVNTVNS